MMSQRFGCGRWLMLKEHHYAAVGEARIKSQTLTQLAAHQHSLQSEHKYAFYVYGNIDYFLIYLCKWPNHIYFTYSWTTTENKIRHKAKLPHVGVLGLIVWSKKAGTGEVKGLVCQSANKSSTKVKQYPYSNTGAAASSSPRHSKLNCTTAFSNPKTK